MIKHYLNLTNGIEWLEEIKNTKEPYSFIRIQSTTLERKNYLKLFNDLDHDFLLHLALGFKCIVYDCGTNRPFSKTIYYGIPLIRYVLNRRWFDLIPDTVNRLNRNGSIGENVSVQYNKIYNELFRWDQNISKEHLKKKLDYYSKYLVGNEISLEGISKSTKNDGNYELYSKIVKNKLNIK